MKLYNRHNRTPDVKLRSSSSQMYRGRRRLEHWVFFVQLFKLAAIPPIAGSNHWSVGKWWWQRSRMAKAAWQEVQIRGRSELQRCRCWWLRWFWWLPTKPYSGERGDCHRDLGHGQLWGTFLNCPGLKMFHTDPSVLLRPSMEVSCFFDLVWWPSWSDLKEWDGTSDFLTPHDFLSAVDCFAQACIYVSSVEVWMKMTILYQFIEGGQTHCGRHSRGARMRLASPQWASRNRSFFIQSPNSTSECLPS